MDDPDINFSHGLYPAWIRWLEDVLEDDEWRSGDRKKPSATIK